MADFPLYGMDRRQAQKQFASYWDGWQGAVVCVISDRRLDELSRDALKKSFAALGYGEAACTFITLAPEGEQALTTLELHHLIEAFDPLVLIMSDRVATDRCGEAYRCEIPVHAPLRLLGRDTRAFVSLETWVVSPEDKRKVWALLKSLPSWASKGRRS